MTEPETSESIPPTRGLSIRQRRALPIVVTARTVEDGCRKAGITSRAWRTWLKQDPFRDAVEEMLDRASSEAAALLQAYLPSAVQAMNAMTRHKNPALRMQALMFMINKGLEASGMSRVDKRLAKLEQERAER